MTFTKEDLERLKELKRPKPMKLKVKKLRLDAVIPTKNNNTDSGFDCTAIDDPVYNYVENYYEYSTGLAVEPEPGYDIKMFPRGSVSKKDLVLANSIGLCDEGYRGELKFRFKPIRRFDDNGKPLPVNIYKAGEKIGQLVVEKREQVELIVVDELEDTERGSGAFGSTEKKAV